MCKECSFQVHINVNLIYLSVYLLIQIEAFRRPSFTEVLDELSEVAETLEPPTHTELTTG